MCKISKRQQDLYCTSQPSWDEVQEPPQHGKGRTNTHNLLLHWIMVFMADYYFLQHFFAAQLKP
ncbi:hypothetical protein B7P43_G01843 [Cryptotermes secundus]|uniref:Uncharacterized protein n=1 Tax=Cryptotermes secundus TaxID=105785 RepID=A0A2J7QWD7_9NEOP|nr:hypothetical protein B7P43_G01843 [Cryptotermes secundus]